MDNDENKSYNLELDMETEKKGRRSSILKPQKPRNPLSSVDFKEPSPDTTLARVSRRVSFASSNFVKPFVADPEKNTIWDNTYEEEVNHTDSTTKSNGEITYQKTSEILNTSSVDPSLFIHEKEEIKIFEEYNEINPKLVLDTVYNETNMEITKCLKSENESISKIDLIAFARKSNPKLNITCNETAPDLNNTKFISNHPAYTDNTMEITNCIIFNKENVNPIVNDISLLTTPNPVKYSKINSGILSFNNLGPEVKSNSISQMQSEDKIFDNTCEMEIDISSRFNNQEIMLSEKQENVDLSTNEKKDLKQCGAAPVTVFETNMEITAPQEVDSHCKDDPTEIGYMTPYTELNSTAQLKKNGIPDNRVSKLGVTNLEYSTQSVHIKEYIAPTNKRKTIYFNEPEDMELTTQLDVKFVQSKLANEERKIDFRRKTVYFNDGNDGMELTTNYIHQNNTQPTSYDKEFERFEFDLNCDNNSTHTECQLKKYKAQTNEKRKTIHFDESGDMELTTQLDVPVVQRKLIVEEETSNSRTENVELGTNLELENIDISKTIVETDKRKTIHVNDDMELTSQFNIEPAVPNETGTVYSNGNKSQTVYFNQLENTMEVTGMVDTQVRYLEKRETIGTDINTDIDKFENNMDIGTIFETQLNSRDKTVFDQPEVNVECTENSNQLLKSSLGHPAQIPENKMRTCDKGNTVIFNESGDMELTKHIDVKHVVQNMTFENNKNQLKGSKRQTLYFKEFENDMEITQSNVNDSIQMVTDAQKQKISSDSEENENRSAILSCFKNMECISPIKSSDNIPLINLNFNRPEAANNSFSKSCPNNQLLDNVHQNVEVSKDNTKLKNNIPDELPIESSVNNINHQQHFKVFETKVEKLNSKELTNENETLKPNVSLLNINQVNVKLEEKSLCNSEFKESGNKNQENSIIHNIEVKLNKDLNHLETKETAPSGHNNFSIYLDRTGDHKNGVMQMEQKYCKKKETMYISKPKENTENNYSKVPGSDKDDKIADKDNKINFENSCSFKKCNKENEKLLQTSSLSSSKVLYSEPLKVKPLPNIEEIETPAVSFNLNFTNMSPGVPLEDTQQLIHATFSKPNSFTYLIPEKNINRSSLNIATNNEYDRDQMVSNLQGPNLEFESHSTEIGYETADKIDTCVRSRHGALETSDFSLIKHEVDEKSSSLSEKSCFFNNMSPTGVLVDDESASDIQENSPNYGNYTLRAESLINNIQKKLVEFKLPKSDDDDEINEMIEKAKIVSKELCRLRKEFKLPKLDIVLLEDLKMSGSCNSSNSVSVSMNIEENVPSPMHIDVAPQKSLNSQIQKASTRCKEFWNLEKMENEDCCKYYFSTLFGVIVFNVTVHPENGQVYSIKTSTKLGRSPAISCFITNIFLQRLEKDSLQSALGSLFDIISLLDYVYMTMEEMINFHIEFNKLEEQYEANHFQMNDDFSITFEILDVVLMVFWKIKVKMFNTNTIIKDDVFAESEVGEKLNEFHIKSIAESTLNGPDCLRNFLNNVFDYYKRNEKKLKFKKGLRS